MITGTVSPFRLTERETDYLLEKLKDGEEVIEFDEESRKKYMEAMTEFERRVDKTTTPSVFSENKVYDGGRLLTLLQKLNSVTNSQEGYE